MSYFSEQYGKLTFPIAGNGKAGLRPSQIAASHAVSAHFFGSTQPAIITMPTGSGKTAIILALPFLLRATRVLILTPSRLVREQIAENFSALADLKKIEALPVDLTAPKVFVTEHAITSNEAWEEMRSFDVVVATVPSVSPRDGVIAEPPDDLFDLVLVDEAHHAPAKTWSTLLEKLRAAKQVLFTATPFRRDEKEIKGKFVFTYDLRSAYNDNVFGDIAFEPVTAEPNVSIDVSIARAAEARLNADLGLGLKHLIMVRTDTISRAKELKEIYDKNTNLRLAFVSGQHGLKHVKAIIEKLQRAELNGIVCVNMFGEGFNLPNLKVAAIHSPHKSLAVTLQFIGRFARTGQSDIGEATFLAEPNNSNRELGELYESGAVWRDIVHNLSSARVETEVRSRDVIDSFRIEAAPDMEDFSLYTVRPYFHTKVFAAPNGVDLTATPDFPERLQVIFKGTSDPRGAVIYVTRDAVRSPWSTDDRFSNVAYDIFIFHHNATAQLLFICASRRQALLYSRLAKDLVDGPPRSLSHSRISRALNDLEAAEFFSVGMRKRHKLGQIESYRMISGPSADKAIQDTDSRTFDRGHCFGKALENGSEITIGVSTTSKVWSNTYDQIPALLDWCDRIAAKILSGENQKTGSKIDLLSSGEELSTVPAGIIAMSWGAEVYTNPPTAWFYDDEGEITEISLLDFEFRILSSRDGEVAFAIAGAEIEWHGRFTINQGDLFSTATQNEPDLNINTGGDDRSIVEYLNEELPSLYCADLSVIEGQSLYKTPDNLDPFGDDNVEVADWAGVDITEEKPGSGIQRSIFEWMEDRLILSEATVVFCDDTAGEIADYISITETSEGVRVKLFHCKATSSRSPGHRVADLYEVCGQAVKSSIWTKTDKLLSRLGHRVTLSGVKGFCKGDLTDAARLLAAQARQQTQFEIYVVQPGVMNRGRSPALSELLAATKYYLSQGGIDVFGLICS